MGSSCSRFLPLSNSGTYSPKDYINQGLNISEKSCWDGNSLLHQCLRGSVDGHFGYCLVCSTCLNRESIGSQQFSQDWNIILLAFKDWIFMFLPWKISFLCWKRFWLKILNTYFLLLDLFCYPFHPYYPGKCNSFLR